jgi:hypothetical protein
MSGTGHQPHSPAGGTTPGAHSNPFYQPVDMKVADDFFNWPRHQPYESLDTPRLVGLLYGLLCVDVSGREVLLPNPRGMASLGAGNHHFHHHARIWFKASSVSEPESAAMGSDDSGAYTYFDIAGSKVEFKAVDDTNKDLPDPSETFATRNNDQQPWMNFKWVRCLKKLTGLPLIGDAQRNDPDLVTARIRLDAGTVAAVPPFSRDGQHNEWGVVQSNGDYVVSATTDSMLWSRPLAKCAKVRMTLTPLGGGSRRDVWIKPQDGAVLCVITHATTMRESDATRLIHSAAFAKLLEGGDASKFPVPELVGIPRPAQRKSSDDVHCECASCP